VDKIVASIIDPALVEIARSKLPLIPGQERLNNIFWFKLVPEQYTTWKTDKQGQALNSQTLQQFERSTSLRHGARPNSSHSQASRKSVLRLPGKAFMGAQDMDSGEQTPVHASEAETGTPRKRMARGGTRSSRLSVSDRRSTKHHKHSTGDDLRKQIHNQLQTKAKQKTKRRQVCVGTIMPEDPFFSFCAQNFALCTYPADVIPKHFLTDPTSLIYHYSDMISRTGTPEHSPRGQDGQIHGPSSGLDGHDLDDELSKQTQKLFNPEYAVVPPSICLCQPTELTAFPRKRWEIKLDFVDSRGLILGDAGWFPGALGQRFCFEAKSDNVDKFITLSEVPQGQLLYMVYMKDTRGSLKKKADHQGSEKEDWLSSGSDADSTSSDAHDSDANRVPRQPRQRALEKRVSTGQDGMMLPALLKRKSP